MSEYNPGPYPGHVPTEQFHKDIMVSFGYAAGYDGEPIEKNPGKTPDERAWWEEGWNRAVAVCSGFKSTKAASLSAVSVSPEPSRIAPDAVSQPVAKPVQKSRNLF